MLVNRLAKGEGATNGDIEERPSRDRGSRRNRVRIPLQRFDLKPPCKSSKTRNSQRHVNAAAVGGPLRPPVRAPKAQRCDISMPRRERRKEQPRQTNRFFRPDTPCTPYKDWMYAIAKE